MTEDEALGLHPVARALQEEERHEEACVALAASAAYFLSSEGENPPDLANILTDWAESLLALCRYEEAESKSRRACGIVVAVCDLLDAETRAVLVPRVLLVRGRILRELGRYEEASVLLLDAIRTGERRRKTRSAE